MDGLAQTLDRLTQLDGVTVLQEVLQERMPRLGVQISESPGVGGVAGLGPAGPGHVEFIEQDCLKLLGAREVEFMARSGVSGLGGMSHASIELGLPCDQHGLINSNARVLHLGQSRGHGHLQFGEEHLGLPATELSLQNLSQFTLNSSATGDGHGLGRDSAHVLRAGQGIQIESGLRLTALVAFAHRVQVYS